MNQYLLIFCCILLFLPSIFAEVDTKKEGIIFDRITYCTNNGIPCVNGACNITIVSPVSTVLYNTQAMTKTGNVYNFTLPKNLTKGTYQEIITCCDSTLCNTAEGNFQITTNGKPENDLYGIVAMCFIVGLLFFFAFRITDSTHFYLQLILIFFALSFALLIPGYFFITSYQSIFFNLFLSFTVVFFIYVFIYYVWFNYKKYLSRTP